MSSIDKYLYELDHPKEPCDRDYYLSPREISCFSNISQDKVELIKSVGKKLPGEWFKSILDLYNNYDPLIENWAYVQCRYKDGSSILYSVALTTTKPTMSIYDNDVITRNIADVSRDYNAHTRIGDQHFTSFEFVKTQHDETDYYHLVYSSDGHVFLNKFDADGIASLDLDDLGHRMAVALKARLEQEAKFNIYRESHPYRKVGVRNLR